jgi:protein SCO1/2
MIPIPILKQVSGWLFLLHLVLYPASLIAQSGAENLSSPGSNNMVFKARGVLIRIVPAEQKICIQHDAIPDYMAAMTMDFRVLTTNVLDGLHSGDRVSFDLHVTTNESWVDGFVKLGTVDIALEKTSAVTNDTSPSRQSAKRVNPLLDFKFTNELGQAVSIHDFKGQALAITFFFTRCPLPEYCPRLSKNFEEASAKLLSDTNIPTNWHLLSFTFDPTNDSPSVLKEYGLRYHYNPEHWSFLTGPADEIEQFVQGSGVTHEPDGGFLNHNFRTLIIDTSGHLQMVFPTSGDLSDQIVSEMRKALHKNVGAQSNN